LVKVGITLLLLHRFDDALWSFREALSVRKHALGPLHPSTARIYNNIGCVHVEFNEFKEARRAFEAALDVQRNALCHDPDSGPLMFGTATTLCNLGYLYRYRDMHAKASLVLKEAVDLQETVLGRSHATVLSTLDNLADSYANSGHAVESLRTYNMILERFRVGGRSDNKKMARAESVLLYKMSRVHRQRNDRAAQLDSLKLALRSMRSFADADVEKKPDSLERRIQYDIRACREQLQKDELKWL
jgi:tetratricopeptide (TPR) repeat protein